MPPRLTRQQQQCAILRLFCSSLILLFIWQQQVGRRPTNAQRANSIKGTQLMITSSQQIFFKTILEPDSSSGSRRAHLGLIHDFYQKENNALARWRRRRRRKSEAAEAKIISRLCKIHCLFCRTALIAAAPLGSLLENLPGIVPAAICLALSPLDRKRNYHLKPHRCKRKDRLPDWRALRRALIKIIQNRPSGW